MNTEEAHVRSQPFSKLCRAAIRVCVIVASGYLDPDVKSRMHNAGVQYFIEKPYKLNELLSTLHGVINYGCEWPNR